MRAPAAIVFAAFGIGQAFAADAVNDTPQAAANGFYAVYRTLAPSGVPDPIGIAKLEPYISPPLDKLLKDAGAAEDTFVRDNPGAPPMIEGDLFTSLFEGANSVAVGTCSENGNRAQCAIALSYSDGKAKPVAWTDTAYLVRTMAGGWRVDDIAYGGTWAFGNKGKLSQSLQYAIETANED